MKEFSEILRQGHRLKAYKTDEGLERISQHDVYPQKYINKLLENTPRQVSAFIFQSYTTIRKNTINHKHISL